MFQGTFGIPKAALNDTSDNCPFEASSHWPSGQRFPRAGQVAARPLNELQWRESVGSQTCGSGKKGSCRGKAPLSWSRLLLAAVVQPCRLCGFLIRSHIVEHATFSSCTQRQHTGIALWPGCVTND